MAINSIKVSDFLKIIDAHSKLITPNGKIMDPSETVFGVLLPLINGRRKYQDFKNIYGFDICESDIGVLKFKAKFSNEFNCTLPTVLDLQEMVENDKQYDLKNYKICIDCEEPDGTHILYHLCTGMNIKSKYAKYSDNSYLLIVLDFSDVEYEMYYSTNLEKNILQRMGVVS